MAWLLIILDKSEIRYKLMNVVHLSSRRRARLSTTDLITPGFLPINMITRITEGGRRRCLSVNF